MSGLLKFIRYGLGPNLLSYCGPADSQAILDYLKQGKVDQGLKDLVLEYTGALPYLKFIARQNQLKDPFDGQVVEAYWIGNQLLTRCDLKDFYGEIKERFRKKVSPKVLELMLGSIPAGAKPHHSFHVLQIFSQIGGARRNIGPSWETINNCLVQPVKIVSFNQDQAQVSHKSILSTYEVDGKRERGGQEKVRVKILRPGEYQKGDWVAIHWGWVCEKINSEQRQQLEYWTDYHFKRMRL